MRTIEMAKEILNQGRQYSAWEEPEGGMDNMTEDQIRGDAEAVVELARGAFNRGITNDAVMEILFAALIEPAEGEPADKYKAVYDRKGAPLPSGGSATSNQTASGNAFEQSTPAAPEQTPVQEQAADGKFEIDSIIEGYDDMKASDLKTLIPQMAADGRLTEEQWAQVKAYEEDNEERKSILKLEPEFKKPEPAPTSPAPASAPTGDYGSSADMAAAYDAGTLGQDRIGQERLLIPQQVTGDPEALPIDITNISDQDLSRLALQYHSFHARTAVLISQEEGRAAAAEHLRAEAEREEYSRIYNQLKGGLDKETASALEAARSEAKHEAAVAESVKVWRARSVRHGIEAKSLKALDDGYLDAEQRLSREQSRREKLAQKG